MLQPGGNFCEVTKTCDKMHRFGGKMIFTLLKTYKVCENMPIFLNPCPKTL